MCTGFIKRFLPFLMTFAAGLLLASFFVSVTAPSFPFSGRRYRSREFQRMQNDYLELKRENERLQNELNEARRSIDWDTNDLNLNVPPPFIPDHVPPPPSRSGRAIR